MALIAGVAVLVIMAAVIAVLVVVQMVCPSGRTEDAIDEQFPWVLMGVGLLIVGAIVLAAA
jgi:hypothetical protein